MLTSICFERQLEAGGFFKCVVCVKIETQVVDTIRQICCVFMKFNSIYSTFSFYSLVGSNFLLIVASKCGSNGQVRVRVNPATQQYRSVCYCFLSKSSYIFDVL
jgi:hypothetical protein